MNPLPIPTLEAQHVDLSNSILRCQRHYFLQLDTGHRFEIDIGIGVLPESPLYRANWLIGGQEYTTFFQADQFQHWLANQLSDIPFENLPDSLQLACIDTAIQPFRRSIQHFMGSEPILTELSRAQSVTQGKALEIGLSDGSQHLSLWLEELQAPVLLRKLPDIDIKQLTTVPIILSKQIAETQLPNTLFKTLAQGDVVFFDRCSARDQHILVAINNWACWQGLYDSNSGSITLTEKVRGTFMTDANHETITHYDDVPITLVFEAGRKEIRIQDLYQLQEGFVFQFDSEAEQAISLKVNGKVIGECELVSVNEKLGARILRLYDEAGENDDAAAS